MNRVTKGLGVFAALLPLVAAVPTAGAATVVAGQTVPSPATALIVDPINGLVQGLTGFPPPQPAFLCQSPSTCVQIIYPFLDIPQGVTLLGAAINSTSGPIIVFTYSQGGQVAEQWLKQNANAPNAPSPANLTFILLGNSTRAYGGSLVEPAGGVGSPSAEVWPQSQYQVIDVARQYEYSADYPNNPLSPFYGLAIVNAIAGGWYLHDYTAVDNLSAINDPANTVWKVGNITYVLIPTPNLPLLDGLRQLGLPALADQLQAQLKPLVDSAYNRNYPGIIQPGLITAQPATAPVSPAPAVSTLSSPVVSDPTVAPRSATVSMSLDPAPAGQAHPAPTSTGPQNANGDLKAGAVTASTTAPSAPPDGLDTVKTITPLAAQRGLDSAIAAKQSTAAPSTHTTSTSTTNGNETVTGKARQNNATTKSQQAGR
jgi:hypothetical protein